MTALTTMTMTLPDGTTTGPFTAEDLKRATEALKKKAPMKDDPDFRKHNQKAYSVTANELRQFIERAETLAAEKRDIAGHEKELFAEAKGRGLRAIVSELRRRLGGGCDANHGGDHLVIKQGTYAFCGNCGESLRGERFCHVPRAASTLESKPNE
jgi:RNA polymerase-binding transcription factor DksA